MTAVATKNTPAGGGNTRREPDAYWFVSVQLAGRSVLICRTEMADLAAAATAGGWTSESHVYHARNGRGRLKSWALAVGRGLRLRRARAVTPAQEQLLALCHAGLDAECRPVHHAQPNPGS